MADVKRDFVTTEGDTLYYEVRGQGPAILMIAAAGGDGDYYAPMADLLADRFKVITYDRRANARSTMRDPQNFTIEQQSRDAAAVIRAAGEERAIVFGNSSGGVIALDMAKTQPLATRAVIAHEPACPSVHPKQHKWHRFFAACYKMAYGLGPTMAVTKFMFGAQLPVIPMAKAQRKAGAYAAQQRGDLADAPRLDVNDGIAFLARQELLPVTNYLPDTKRIRENGVPVFTGTGQWGIDHKTWYADTSRILAERFGHELVVFPGHHGAYMDETEAFVRVMRGILDKIS